MDFIHRVPPVIPIAAESLLRTTPDHRVVRAARYLEWNIDARIAIGTVARQFGLSHHYFHRLFVAETGETPAGYLRRIRLDAAASRLCETGESVGAIGSSLGYDSQAAFTRAFEERFSISPGRFRHEFKDRRIPPADIGNLRKVRLRHVDSFCVVAKRYVGDLYAVRSYWRDFAAALPPELARRRGALFLGLKYDDTRFTPRHQTRYDCCMTIGQECADSISLLRARGLHIIRTRAGRYGCFEHVGSWRDVAGSYYLLKNWWLPNSLYASSHAPCIELHAVRRDLQPPDALSFTILQPLE